MSIFTKIFGDPNDKVIQSIRVIVDQVNALEPTIQALSDEELKAKTEYFKSLLSQGKTLDDILPEVFAVVREASKRTTGLRHFDVQLIGGVVLHKGEIAEMKTGEGKTLVGTLATYLNALTGRGVHVVTVNDYLSSRDATWMGQVYNFLGLTVGVIQHESSFIYDESWAGNDVVDQTRDEEASFKVEKSFLKPVTRKEAYACDITYGTNNEFGFDFLRDNMVGKLEEKVQRPFYYAIVDEVDSILIDEARTPLIISAPAEESAAMYDQFAHLVPKLEVNIDYNVDEKMKATTLTEAGLNKIEKLLGMGNIYTEGGIEMVHHLEQALKAHALFKKDKDYVVKDGEIMIIDEFTGRMMPGRRYSEGLHQALEAKEGVEVKKESRTLATITFQNYFRLYEKLSGMTGTALTEAEEFNKIYNLDVTLIPTNKELKRKDLTDRVYSTELGKFKAAAREIKELHAKGQPVLVGTISIEKSELLSQLLEKEGVPHQVLNAKHHEKEAQIVAQAGRVGAVTVATNMACSGVDMIRGGAPFNEEEYKKVVNAGGLFVLGTERHESRRIDNQLRGRSGRQGDPGNSQFYVSMEDDLMRIFGSDRVKSIMQTFGMPEDMPIENGIITRSIETSQRKVEEYYFDVRKHLVDYDDIMNKQREAIYKRRDEILAAGSEDTANLRGKIMEMIEDELEQVVSFHTAEAKNGDWDLKEIVEVAGTIFPVPGNLLEELNKLYEESKHVHESEIRTIIFDKLMALAKQAYENLHERIKSQAPDKDYLPMIENEILLRSIDNLWVEHLDSMNTLRTGIGLQGYAQRDPLVEYKREARQMYIELLNLIQKQVVYSIYKVGLNVKQPTVTAPENLSYSDTKSSEAFNPTKDPYQTAKHSETKSANKNYTSADHKVGRNDPCPCGSGKKYKKCHGG